MKSQKRSMFLNPVGLCGIILFTISAPKVLTETNCECLILSKFSGDEWIGDCADTTTGMSSTTYTVTTPADVADPGKYTDKPPVTSPSDNITKAGTNSPNQPTVPATLTSVITRRPTTTFPKPLTKPSTKAPATPKPSTKPPATPKPSTKPPVTPKPSTKPPATPKPSAKPPVTPKPSTKPPATPKPTSKLTTTRFTTKLTSVKTTVRATIGKPAKVTTPTVAVKSSPDSATEQPGGKDSQAEPVSKSAVDGATIGVVVGAAVGVTAIVLLVVLFWRFGVLKRWNNLSCRRSKVSSYDTESGEISQNGTKPGEKALKTM